MLTARRLAFFLLTASFAPLGCRAQSAGPAAQSPSPAAQNASQNAVIQGSPLPLALTRRVEVLLRQKAQLPPGSEIHVSSAQPSDFPGYNKITISFSNEGKTSRPIDFLVSTDGKSLAQFNKFDISADPRTMLSTDGRPGRGGTAAAPVLIVGFDDLECPYCARLHQTIFPAILTRYGDKIHIVYKDFPLDQHPWAMHAAVDVNCLGSQSTPGYWNLVDYIHAHAAEIGTAPAAAATAGAAKESSAGKDSKAGTDDKLQRADTDLDTLTREQAKLQKADLTQLNACIAKQDTTAIQVEQKLATSLNIDSTPTLFINGDKIDGALPIEFIFNVIDDALRAEGVAPPPPYVAPPAPVSPAPGDPATQSAPSSR